MLEIGSIIDGKYKILKEKTKEQEKHLRYMKFRTAGKKFRFM